MKHSLPVCLLVMVAACTDDTRATPSPSSSGGDAETSSTPTSSSSSTTATPPDSDDTTSTTAPGSSTSSGADDSSTAADDGATVTTGGTTGGDPGCGPGATIDIDPEDVTCDVWLQDCAAGQKCVPWVSGEHGLAYDATRCVVVAEPAAAVGEPCTSPLFGSGDDDCDADSICVPTPASPEQAVCVAMCSGSEASPVCADGQGCAVANGGVVALCFALCNPLEQEACGDAMQCIPFEDTFSCFVDNSSEKADGSYGAACEGNSLCDPGLACLDASRVPGCGASHCCTPFCALDDPGDPCPGSADGQVCDPWYDDGASPPGLEQVGVCRIPCD